MASTKQASKVPTVTPRRWMSAQEVSEYLGVSRRTVWDWLDRGVLTRRKISRTVRIDRLEVEGLLSSRGDA